MRWTRAGSIGAVLALAISGVARGDADSAFLYVASDTTLYSFAVDPATGSLSPAAPPMSLGTIPRTLTVASAGPFVYVAGVFPTTVLGFTPDPASGALTPLPGSPFAATGDGAIAAAIGGSGRFLYVGNNNSQDVSAYAIDLSGQLTLVGGGPFAVTGVVGSGSLAADPLGRFVYVATGAITAALSVFHVDPATGALVLAEPPLPLPGGANIAAADPTGRFLYVASAATNQVSAFVVDAGGALTPVPGSPFPAGASPASMIVHASGGFLLVGGIPGAIAVHSIDTATGALAPVAGSPFATGFQPRALEFDASGHRLYVADVQGFQPPPMGQGGVWVHDFDVTTGSLTVVSGSPFPAGMSPLGLGLVGGAPAATPTLALAPASAVNTVGTSQTVTASVGDGAGGAMDGVVVRFTVTGATSTSGSCTTAASGQCTFTYVGPLGPGTDTISAFADLDGDGAADPGEPMASASKTWVLPASTCGEVEGVGSVRPGGHGAFALNVEFETGHSRPRGAVVYGDVASNVWLVSTSIDAAVFAPGSATVFGRGRANGMPVRFRVDATDDHPDRFGISLSNGYSREGAVVQGGLRVEGCRRSR